MRTYTSYTAKRDSKTVGTLSTPSLAIDSFLIAIFHQPYHLWTPSSLSQARSLLKTVKHHCHILRDSVVLGACRARLVPFGLSAARVDLRAAVGQSLAPDEHP